jgi:hypothetical protein
LEEEEAEAGEYADDGTLTPLLVAVAVSPAAELSATVVLLTMDLSCGGWDWGSGESLPTQK